MSLKTFFSKNLSTNDNSSIMNLRPHYYLNDYQTIKKRIIEVAESLKYTVVSVDDNYYEIFVENKGYADIIFTCVRTATTGTRVDIKTNIQMFISLGTAEKIIKEFYKQLDQKLNRKSL